MPISIHFSQVHNKQCKPPTPTCAFVHYILMSSRRQLQILHQNSIALSHLFTSSFTDKSKLTYYLQNHSMNKSVDHNHSSSETNSFESETTSSSKSSILSAGTVSPDHVTKQDDHDTHQLPQESFPWNQYICFLLINCAATAAVQFYQGIAKNALSVRSVPAIIFSQYAMQMFCNLTTPYWTSWLSHKTRIRISTFLFIFNFPLQSLVFQSNDHITLGCVMLNGMAAVITEITLLQYGSFYHK
eukprot:548613_1